MSRTLCGPSAPEMKAMMQSIPNDAKRAVRPTLTSSASQAEVKFWRAPAAAAAEDSSRSAKATVSSADNDALASRGASMSLVRAARLASLTTRSLLSSDRFPRIAAA